MDTPLHAERRGSVAWLTLNRPQAGNAIDVDMAVALGKAVDEIAADRDLRAVVITGAGKLFCAGGDIRTFTAGGSRAAAIDAITSRLHPAIAALASLQKPIVTLVNGPAAGAGLGLALVGDLVVASRSAHFTSAYTSIGLTPDGGTSWLLARAIGLKRASEMVLTNRRIGAEEAERVGLINRVVDDDALEREGEATAQSLANGAVGALAASRELLASALGADLQDQLAAEARTIAARAETQEGAEGISSFLDGRRADFRGTLL